MFEMSEPASVDALPSDVISPSLSARSLMFCAFQIQKQTEDTKQHTVEKILGFLTLGLAEIDWEAVRQTPVPGLCVISLRDL